MTEVIDGTAVEVSNEPADSLLPPDFAGWAGDQPVFLIFEPVDAGDAGNIGIDIDVAGWIEGNRDTFRRPGVWFLIDKATSGPLLAMPTEEGDQFYYHRHMVGVIGTTNGPTVTVQAIGKKRADGSVVRLWLMPNGMVMTGEDWEIDPVASRMVVFPLPGEAAEITVEETPPSAPEA